MLCFHDRFGHGAALSHIASARLSVKRDARGADVGQLPAVLADGFAQEGIVVFEAAIWPVQRAYGSSSNQPTTAQNEEPPAVTDAAIFKVELPFAARPPGRRWQPAIPRRASHESE